MKTTIITLLIIATGCTTDVQRYTVTPVSNYGLHATGDALDYDQHVGYLEELQTKHNLPGLDYDNLAVTSVRIVPFAEIAAVKDNTCAYYRHHTREVVVPTKETKPVDMCPQPWDVILSHELAHAGWYHVPEMAPPHTHPAWRSLGVTPKSLDLEVQK